MTRQWARRGATQGEGSDKTVARESASKFRECREWQRSSRGTQGHGGRRALPSQGVITSAQGQGHAGRPGITHCFRGAICRREHGPEIMGLLGASKCGVQYEISGDINELSQAKPDLI
ncbi:hypothetical protein E2C01_099790 [Portunus trituberculatus]|uniref:Uncharacterized protein n=1 Tax=Portunus trituberculatus TaxID=210409 RepID=A0A5B7KG93_PORTR|nr:hypothetical protein [Portunus trituberculatus]